MTDQEEQLRHLLHDAAGRRRLTAPSVAGLLRAHRRSVVRRRVMALASVSATGVITAAGITAIAHVDSGDTATVAPSTGGGPRTSASCVAARSAASPASQSSTSSLAAAAHKQAEVAQQAARAAAVAAQSKTSAANPTPTPVASGPAAGPAAQQDPALASVCLPNPAPGFPLRRLPDETSMTSFGPGVQVLAKTFLLGAKPPTVTTYSNGSYGATPTGPEATVIVARTGAFPTSPTGIRAQGLYSVTGTTQARGVTATVVRVDAHQIGVIVTVSGFDVAAYGENTADPSHPVTAEQLVALIDSLEHLGR